MQGSAQRILPVRGLRHVVQRCLRIVDVAEGTVRHLMRQVTISAMPIGEPYKNSVRRGTGGETGKGLTLELILDALAVGRIANQGYHWTDSFHQQGALIRLSVVQSGLWDINKAERRQNEIGEVPGRSSCHKSPSEAFRASFC